MAALESAGHVCLLACDPASKIAEVAGQRGASWHPVAFRNSFDLPSLWALRGLIRHHRIGVGIGHSGHDFNTLAIAARLANPRPTILRMRTYQPGVPRAFTYNVLADRTLVPSEYLRGQILKNTEIRPSGVAVLRPVLPIDELRREAGQPLPGPVAERLAGKGPVIAHAAMLRSEKGHRVAIAAVARLLEDYPHVRYVIAGAGKKEADFKALAASLGAAENVVFAGLMIPVAPLLARADVVIMPSLNEPLGLSQLEALVLGTPVAVSDAGGLPETVEHGATGWVLPAGDVGAWEQGLREILRDPAEAKARAERGRVRVEEQFSVGTFLKELPRQLEVANRG
jgi:glycosyltransferase involved in cell wall biosynthesis